MVLAGNGWNIKRGNLKLSQLLRILSFSVWSISQSPPPTLSRKAQPIPFFPYLKSITHAHAKTCITSMALLLQSTGHAFNPVPRVGDHHGQSQRLGPTETSPFVGVLWSDLHVSRFFLLFLWVCSSQVCIPSNLCCLTVLLSYWSRDFFLCSGHQYGIQLSPFIVNHGVVKDMGTHTKDKLQAQP